MYVMNNFMGSNHTFENKPPLMNVVWLGQIGLSDNLINLLFKAFANTLKLQLIRLVGLNFLRCLASTSLGTSVIIA